MHKAFYLEILEPFMFPSADKIYGDVDYHFQQDLAPAHRGRTSCNWFTDYAITALDWLATHLTWTP